MRAMLSSGLLIAALAPMACGNPTESEARQVQSRLVPPGGEASPLSVNSEPNAVLVRWTVRSPWKWAQYAAWAATQLRPEFQQYVVAEGIGFRRSLSGDAYTVVIEPQAGVDMNFELTFSARPF